MRAIPGRLLPILEGRLGSPVGSARSSCTDASRLEGLRASTCSVTSFESEETAYELLHKEQGFEAFRSWYLQQLQHSECRPDLGLFFPQASAFPGTVHEYAFMDFLRLFLECSDAEALNFFRLLDANMLGALKFQQIYLAIVLISALASRQLTKCLYLHSRWLFDTITATSEGERSLPWPRLQLLLQLLGANWIFVSRSYPGACHFSPQTQLRHEEFVEVLFAVLAQLEAGSDAQVIRPRDAVVKSKACALL